MAAFNKFNNLIDGLFKGAINLGTGTIKCMLTNTAPVATNTKYSDVSGNELASGNGYSTGGATVSGTGVSNNGGVESLAAQPVTFQSTTGTMGPFRYVIFYDSTSGYLIGWYDYGSTANLNGSASETFSITLQNNVLLQGQ